MSQSCPACPPSTKALVPLLRKRAREPGDLEGKVDAVNVVEEAGEVVAKAEVSVPILCTPQMEIREVPRLERKNMRNRSHLVTFALQKKGHQTLTILAAARESELPVNPTSSHFCQIGAWAV